MKFGKPFRIHSETLRSFFKILAAASFAGIMLTACGDEEESQAVVEEAPAWDESTPLVEEPPLQSLDEPEPEPEPMPEPEPAPISAPQPGETGRYVVQVSVTKTAGMAEYLMGKLADKGYPAYVSAVENPTPELYGTYHRVRIGRFRTVTDAKLFGENVLTPMGYGFGSTTNPMTKLVMQT